MGLFEIVFVVGGLVVWVVLAVLVGQFAERRGRSFVVFFLLSLLISFLLSLALLMVLPQKSEDVGAWGVTTGPDAVRGEGDGS